MAGRNLSAVPDLPDPLTATCLARIREGGSLYEAGVGDGDELDIFDVELSDGEG